MFVCVCVCMCMSVCVCVCVWMLWFAFRFKHLFLACHTINQLKSHYEMLLVCWVFFNAMLFLCLGPLLSSECPLPKNCALLFTSVYDDKSIGSWCATKIPCSWITDHSKCWFKHFTMTFYFTEKQNLSPSSANKKKKKNHLNNSSNECTKHHWIFFELFLLLMEVPKLSLNCL